MVKVSLILSFGVVWIACLSTEAFAPTLSHRTSAFQTNKKSFSHHSTELRATRSDLSMKLSKSSGSRKGGKDSVLGERNSQRVATAGKVGTKRFVDPTKVFIGNLPYTATEKDIMKFFGDHMGHTRNIHAVNLIRDWRTGKSKGYGFVVFTDPMFATCAMEFCKNKKVGGRIIAVNQGQKKLDPNDLYIKKKKNKPADKEESAILQGLEEAEEQLAEQNEGEGVAASLEEFDASDDQLLFGDGDDDDDDFEFDGVFEEMYPPKFDPLTEEEEKMNREQRREAAKRKKRRKLPHKGFDGISSSYNDQFEETMQMPETTDKSTESE